MGFRKKHKEESEVFTDSLNDILFILLMFFLIVATLANPNIIPVQNPKADKEGKARQNIMVSIDKQQQFYLGGKKVPSAEFDSLLTKTILRYKEEKRDTPTVIINADTAALYGEVFRVMRVAKLVRYAKVFAQVDD
ncbi:MAG: biopolymer transporter ExbD [Chitinophagaceae bacterium]|nr:biopolymer transporter ExbD [Chitinophagaceae bacterium]